MICIIGKIFKKRGIVYRSLVPVIIGTKLSQDINPKS